MNEPSRRYKIFNRSRDYHISSVVPTGGRVCYGAYLGEDIGMIE